MNIEDQRSRLGPRVIDSLYVEAMLLADEARAYFDHRGRDERKSLSGILQVGFSCESLKVTTRLMHVVAWLMTQRAVEAGDLSRTEELAPKRRLAPAAESDEELLPQLPQAARDIIAASCELYARVERIDGSEGESSSGSPARSLITRLERSF